MTFRVAARTILQLGSELISSDAIAFYELIKNSFDAHSPTVDIRIVSCYPYQYVQSMCAQLNGYIEEGLRPSRAEVDELKAELLSNIDGTAPAIAIKQIKEQINQATSFTHFIKALERANWIEINDSGEGMSIEVLNDAYLTIGTRSRFRQRKLALDRIAGQNGFPEERIRPILGEKGVGRLSAMRLGHLLDVQASHAGESHWNCLSIDWDIFSHDSDAMLDEIPVTARTGHSKEDPLMSGTRITISRLTSAWSREKLERIVEQEFTKFVDPFNPQFRYPMAISFNREKVRIRPINKIIFENAHAFVHVTFSIEADKPKLSGRIDYKLQKREKYFEVEGSHLLSISKMNSLFPLKSLGPFELEFYWYNRRILTALEGIGDRKTVLAIVNDWAGGLMLYRDGFRVLPYGSPNDDWLQLDQKALGSSGYKVNRRQIIGKVAISSISNPNLTDQTNREGLRDCDEKQALINILRHVVSTEFKTFLDSVDKELRAREPVSFHDLEERVTEEEVQIENTLRTLVSKYPEVKQDTRILSGIRTAIQQIKGIMVEAKEIADSYQEGRSELVHLAGLGLMVEIVAHELNRATSHTLSILHGAGTQTKSLPSLFGTLEEQLKTLQKRLRVLDPLSTRGRQVKSSFDLVGWVKENIKAHEAQFKRHGIVCEIITVPNTSSPILQIKAVKGMIVQILENLVSNSVYWLQQQKKIAKDFHPKITVTILLEKREIYFSDNGPGIDPDRKEDVFLPFFTTKPPGEGKGLGLYISREIAVYNGASLFMPDKRSAHIDRLNTFVLAMEPSRNE